MTQRNRQTSITTPPADYYPLASGRYETGPGLKPFGSDFGNGDHDRQVFQFDDGFASYRASKLEARRERLSKYYRSHMLPVDGAIAIGRFIIERLTLEHPDLFQLNDHRAGEVALHCRLTGETLFFDQRMRFLRAEREGPAPVPDYHDSLDALACQVQEDLAIVCKSALGRDWLAAIHLCHANHWAAEDKIGLPFEQVHQPVPGMRNSARDAGALVDAIVTKGPFVRFAWGLTVDDRLNLHPWSHGIGSDRHDRRQYFDATQPRLFLRVERQILWPFPEQLCALFTIRTYLVDCAAIRVDAERNSQLIAAIRSMTGEQLHYKGLDKDKPKIIGWLVRGNMRTPPSEKLANAIKRLF